VPSYVLGVVLYWSFVASSLVGFLLALVSAVLQSSPQLSHALCLELCGYIYKFCCSKEK
jgi:hypothetical protein